MESWRIFKNSVWLIVGDWARRLLTIVTIAVLARGLGVGGFGQYALAQSYNLMLMPVLGFGLAPFMIRETARDKQRASWYLSRFVALRVLIAVFYLIFIVLTSTLLPGYSTELRVLILLQAAWVIINGFYLPFRNVFFAFEKMQYEALISTLFGVMRLAFVALTIGLALSIRWVASSDALAATTALVAALVVYARRFGKVHIAFDWVTFKEWMVPILPLLLLSVAREALGRLSSVVLSWSYDSATVGTYEAAARLVFMLHIFAMYLTQSAYPQMSVLSRLDAARLSRVTANLIKLALALAIPPVVTMFAAAPTIVSLIYGPGFQQAVGVLRLLVWVVLPFSGAYVVNYFLIARDLQGVALKLTLCGLGLYAAVWAPLIPLWGLNGAAIATVVGISCWALLLLVYCVAKGYLRLSELLPSPRDWIAAKAFFRWGARATWRGWHNNHGS